jgi:hypothetical protein
MAGKSPSGPGFRGYCEPLRPAFSKHRLKIARRTANDLKHLRRGRLLLQRLLEFIEQPSVLDGNDGLGGEVLDQFEDRPSK